MAWGKAHSDKIKSAFFGPGKPKTPKWANKLKYQVCNSIFGQKLQEKQQKMALYHLKSAVSSWYGM